MQSARVHWVKIATNPLHEGQATDVSAINLASHASETTQGSGGWLRPLGLAAVAALGAGVVFASAFGIPHEVGMLFDIFATWKSMFKVEKPDSKQGAHLATKLIANQIQCHLISSS